MATVTANVDEINSRTVNTKWGAKPVYDITCDGYKYSFGWKKPSFGVGSTISFEATSDAYGQKVVDGTVKVIVPLAPTAIPLVSGHSIKATTYPIKKEKEWVFPIPPLDWQRNVIRAQAIASALEWIKFKDTKASLTLEGVVDVAKRFESYIAGDDDTKGAMEDIATMEATSKALKGIDA